MFPIISILRRMLSRADEPCRHQVSELSISSVGHSKVAENVTPIFTDYLKALLTYH